MYEGSNVLGPDYGVVPARPPVVGFQGTARQAGVFAGNGKNFYVDPNHAVANDENDGTDPNAPMATLQGLIDRTVATNAGTSTKTPIIEDWDNIWVIGHLAESVSILSAATMGNYCNLIGIGNNHFFPWWQSGAADEPCFIMGCNGWRVSGFRFGVPTAAAAIVLPAGGQAPYPAAATGTRCFISGNFFDGSIEGTGIYGIDLYGAPWDVTIENNHFGLIANAANTATAIVSTNTGFANARATKILNNWFFENDNDIVASLNMGRVEGNVFSLGGAAATIQTLDLRGGTQGQNMVHGNAFGDADYSQAGGFWPNAANPGGWAGNTSEDTAEGEVDGSGWTNAPPA